MRYLKTYESFEYHGQQYAERLCDEWGMIDLEDLENLFLEFADEGQVLIHPMLVNKEIKVTIHKIWEDLNDSDWLYNPLWDTRFASIKKQLERLGLTLTVESKNLPQRFVSVRVSKIGKVKESFEVVWNPISLDKFISDCGLVMEDIEDIFLEYSDLGYLVSFMPNQEGGAVSGIIADVTGFFSEEKSEPFGDETIEMINRIKNNSERLGLTFGDYPERLNDFTRNGISKGTIRFYLSNDNI